MWTQDTITYNGKAYRYAVKHFEEPSEFGDTTRAEPQRFGSNGAAEQFSTTTVGWTSRRQIETPRQYLRCS